MRIISGKLKGIKFLYPKYLKKIKPTKDLAKEALFNILNNKISFYKLNILDLFCGTGNISYEFASRDVLKIISIDINQKCIFYIKNNIKKYNILNKITILKYDVFKFLKKKIYINMI